MVGSSSVTMHPLINVTIEPGEMKAFAVQAEDFTSMSIPEGVISGFDTDLTRKRNGRPALLPASIPLIMVRC